MSAMRIGVRAFINSHLLSKAHSNNSLQSVRTFSVTNNRNMKFVQFTHNSEPDDIRVGYLDGDKVVDINHADASMPSTMLDILRKGVANKISSLPSRKPDSVPLSSVKLMAPIHGIDKILCVALNYADHCKEQNLEEPKLPIIFSKFSSTIIGPNEAVRIRTDICKKVDWEVELAVIIGKKASFVKAAEANDYIFGYTVAQDISGRDWQKEKNGGQFILGKSQDTFCPIGPCIATADEVGDPQSLDIKCSVNGVLKQSSNTCQLIHSIANVIERLTSVMTLLPGDLILTGTPGGVGVHRKPPEFLQPGDVLYSEIQKIGNFEVKVEKFYINGNMKFLQYAPNDAPNQTRAGYLVGDKVYDIGCLDCSMPRTILGVLQRGNVDAAAILQSSNPFSTPLSSVTLKAPINGMDKIIGLILNYSDYCKEVNVDTPAIPTVFSKFSSTIIGQNQAIRIRTDVCKKVDYEVELAVVIGKRTSSVKAEDANKYIFGYTIAQDISDREWQREKNGAQFLLGKSQDTFCPIGPYIVTPDEIGDVSNLNLSCSVNGVLKQNSNTANMVHSIPKIIERLSTVMTLLPGDLILTGTPAGVGYLRNPPEFLQPGDVLRSEIEKIGVLEVKVEKF